MSKDKDKIKIDKLNIRLKVGYNISMVGYGTISPSDTLEVTETEYDSIFKHTGLFKIIK